MELTELTIWLMLANVFTFAGGLLIGIRIMPKYEPKKTHKRKRLSYPPPPFSVQKMIDTIKEQRETIAELQKPKRVITSKDVLDEEQILKAFARVSAILGEAIKESSCYFEQCKKESVESQKNSLGKTPPVCEKTPLGNIKTMSAVSILSIDDLECIKEEDLLTLNYDTIVKLKDVEGFPYRRLKSTSNNR